jgi:acyl-CoA dehydrogenase
MLGPALLRFGTETQKKKYLPPIVRGEVWWCQGYSEPNAGSDLVSLQTKAEAVGDEFVINGQKIWTSYGHLADAMFCLVRTDTTKPRHDGISFILIEDMTAPGVKASPLRLISGNEHFSQVFFDNVRVPKENLVGTLNKGWDVAKYLMLFERQMIGGANLGGPVPLSTFALKTLGAERLKAEPMLRAQIMDLEIENECLDILVDDFREMMAAGANLGARSSIIKYLATELGVKRHAMMLSILGNAGIDLESEDGKIAIDWLSSLANRIGGGTSEIQLNVVAKRVLELPGG